MESGLRPDEAELLVLDLVLFTAGVLLVKVDPVIEAQAEAAYEHGIDLLLAGALALVQSTPLTLSAAAGTVPSAATSLDFRIKGDPMADALSALECSGYTVTDPHFGAPYVDRDEWHDEPHGHRRIHGGFADCDTRFTFYFPALEEWQGRLIMPLEGAHAGHEDFFGGALGDAMGGIGLTARLGGYMVESNMGHIGDDIDPKGR